MQAINILRDNARTKKNQLIQFKDINELLAKTKFSSLINFSKLNYERIFVITKLKIKSNKINNMHKIKQGYFYEFVLHPSEKFDFLKKIKQQDDKMQYHEVILDLAKEKTKL